MTISASGTVSSAEGVGLTSITVASPTIGYMRVLTTGLLAATAVSSVSGGGVGTWANAVINNDTTNGTRSEIWWGAVTNTSTNPTTVTVSWGGSTTGINTEFVSQMFSSTATSPTWSLGTTGTSRSSSSTSIAYPTLAPSSGTVLYAGYAFVGNSGGAGSTSGFSYTVTPGYSNVFCYDTSVSASVSPTATESPAGSYDTVAALFSVSSGANGFFMTGNWL